MAIEVGGDPNALPVEETTAPVEGSADPKANAGAGTSEGIASSAQTTSGTAGTATSQVNEPDYKTLSAKAESERDALRAELDALKSQVERFKPYSELEEVAKKDPAQWLAEMAAATGVTPERVLEIVAKRGAGDKPSLTAEERVARMEARFEEYLTERQREREENDRRAGETRAAEQRRGNISVVGEFIKANGKDLPGLDEQDAERVYAEVESQYAALRDWEKPKDQAGLRKLYLDAARRVEAGIRADIERRSGRLGYSKPTQVKVSEAFRGLSLASTTAPAPVEEMDRVNTPEDIDALAARWVS